MSVVVKNLNVAYGKKQVLHDISFDVKQGELLSLLGPSGCGKSTLLKTMAGLLRQQSGNFSIDDATLDDVPAHRRGVVMVFQDLRLFPHMTVLENVAFPLKMAGIDKTERLTRASEMLDHVQLTAFGSRKPSSISGGQQQRVALARALVAQPKLLLLDEPFSGLDSSLRNDMHALLRQLHQRNRTTMILVTHDYREALMLSDSVAVMSEGRVIQCDTPKNLYKYPLTKQIAEYFIYGNQIPGEIRNGKFAVPVLSLPAPHPDGAYTAILRPESISLHINPTGEFTVSRIDFLGESLTIHVTNGNSAITATAPLESNLKPGDKVTLDIPEGGVLYYPM